MLINDKMINPGLDDYYSPSFMNMIESHKEFIINTRGTNTIYVEDSDISVYKGDLYGLLNKLNVPMNLHWVVMRLSGMYNTNEFNEKYRLLVIPLQSTIDKLRQQLTAINDEMGI